jgi:hypothetical protein
MKIEIELTPEQEASLAELVAARMVEMGAAVAAPVRTRPYTVAEAAEVLGMSQRQVRMDVEKGLLKRVPNTARVLIRAASLEDRLEVPELYWAK